MIVMNKLVIILICFGLMSGITACDKTADSPQVRIATNPWPGYELLFLAEKQGYFKQEGLNIKLLQLASLVDVQRTFNQGRADGMASTVIESIIVAALNNEKIKIALIPDYSFGGDVILSSKEIKSVKDLKAKKIGVEAGSLGVVILEKALKKNSLSIEDISYVNLEQLKMKEMLDGGKIDASVTYPPFSTEILRGENYHTVFTTREIPGQIIDVISLRQEVIEEDPEWVNKFHKAWSKALDYLESNPEQALAMMAAREGITVDEFKAALNDMHVLKKNELKSSLNDGELLENIESVCSILVGLKVIETQCDNITDLVSPVLQ